MAASIEAIGLLQPIVLLGEYGKPPYSVMVGQRRYLAHRHLGKRTIKAVFEDNLNRIEVLIRSLSENMHRVNLNHADAARAVTYLYENYLKKLKNNKKAAREVCKVTGMSLQRVGDYIRIQALASPAMMKMLKEKDVTLVDLKRSLRAARGNIDKAENILRMMEKFRLTTHQKKRLVEYGEENPEASEKKIIDEAKKPRVERTVIVSLSDELQDALGKATKELAMEPEEVAEKALNEWLSNQGFIK